MEEKNPALSGMVLEPVEEAFKRDKTRLMIRMLIVSTIVIFTIETLLMLLLDYYLVLPKTLVVFLDGLILVTCLLPFNYRFIVLPIAQEIEKHRRTNLDLVKSNDILERFFSISDVLIAYLDADFKFIRVNQAYANFDKLTPDDFIGKTPFELFPRETNRSIFESVVKTGNPYYVVEKPMEHVGDPRHKIGYWDWSLLPIKNRTGQVIAILMVLNNVSDRKQAQQALVESERRFRAVFNQTFQHIGLLDPAGRILVANQTLLDFSGTTHAEIEKIPLWQLPWWDESSEPAEKVQAVVQQAANGEVVRCESRVKSAAGLPTVVDSTIKPLLDEHEKTVMLIYEARDITERIEAEETLMRSEGEMKRLYQVEMRAHHMAETLRNAGMALSGSLNSSTVLETLLDHLFKVVPSSSTHISLLEDEDHLVFRVARGEENWPETDRLMGKRFEIDNFPFLQSLLNERKILSIPDTTLFVGPSFLPCDQFVKSWLGLPLMVGDKVIGMCMLEHFCPNYFTEELIEWANALTSQAGVAIQNAWLFEQVRDGRENLQALSRRLVEAQEFERYYIARELHDDAGQALASLMVGLRLLEMESANPEAVVTHSQELKKIADGVLDNLHRLAIGLRPASLDHLGLAAAIRQHADMIGNQHGLIVRVDTVGSLERMPGEVETAIYRIVQEALTNVIRHAQATCVDILLEKRDDNLLISVEDNGIGFDPQHEKEARLGMVGMRERAMMLNGNLTIESTPGKGSTILLEVPCQFAS